MKKRKWKKFDGENKKTYPKKTGTYLVTAICGNYGLMEYYVYTSEYNKETNTWDGASDNDIIVAWKKLPHPFKIKER